MAGKKTLQPVDPVQKSTDSPKTDSVKSYVSEAVKNGFAVIDVNLPKHITEDEVSDACHTHSTLIQC
jgi:hypothetical protein